MKIIFRLIFFIVNILAAFILLISAYGGHVNPQYTSLPGVLHMLFPVILAGIIVLLLFDLITWRRMAFMPAFAILFCAPTIWSFCPMNISSPQKLPGEQEIKIMSYNVYHLNNYTPMTDDSETNATLSIIIKENADIVCIQEGASNRVHGLQQDTIYTRYPYREEIDGAVALWSKHPFETVEIPQPDDPTAAMLCAHVNIDGTILTLYNVHLQSIGLNQADKELYGSLTRKPTAAKLEDARYGIMAKLSSAMKKRAQQAEMLRHTIDSIGGDRIIVAGDFNDIENCYAMRVIQGKNLHSTYSEVGHGPMITYFVNRFYFNIDHILYGGYITPLSFDCLKIKSSDHYPIVATFALPKNSAK